MRALRFASGLFRKQPKRLLLTGLAMSFCYMTFLTEDKEHQFGNYLANIQTPTPLALRDLGRNHPSTILLPQSVSQQFTHMVQRYFPSHRLYSVQGNKIFMTNQNQECRVFEIDSEDDMSWLHFALNFMNPPKLTSKYLFEKYLSKLEKDQCIVYTFLPEKEKYQEWVGPIDPLDKFSANKVKDLQQISTEFNHLKYQSSNNKALYVTIKSQELAKKLGIGYRNVGDYYVIRKSSKLNNNQSNFIFGEQRCHVQKVQPDVNKQETTFDFKFKKNFIRSASFPYVNEINIDTDYFNIVRSVKQGQTGNLMVVGIGDDQKPEYIERIHKVLFELKKIFKEQLDILVTQNNKLLTNNFHIEPDEFVTLRLLNVHKTQSSIKLFENFQINSPVADKKKIFTRYKYTGPFKYTEMVEFIRNSSKIQYYQEKNKLKLIKKIMPYELEKASGLVLYQKKGCGGCQFLNGVMQQLQAVIKQVSTKGPKTQDYIYMYKITNPQKLKDLKLYRYNILNEHPKYKSPLTTPQLFLFKDGAPKQIDLAQQSFLDPKEFLKKLIQAVSQ